MTVAALDAHNLGFAIGTLMIPLIGLILLIVGLVERARSQKAAAADASGISHADTTPRSVRTAISPATARLRASDTTGVPARNICAGRTALSSASRSLAATTAAEAARHGADRHGRGDSRSIIARRRRQSEHVWKLNG